MSTPKVQVVDEHGCIVDFSNNTTDKTSDWELACLSSDGGTTVEHGIVSYDMTDPLNPVATLFIGSTDVTATHQIVDCQTSSTDHEHVSTCFQNADGSLRYTRVVWFEASDPTIITETVWLDTSGNVVPEPANVEPCTNAKETRQTYDDCGAKSDTIVDQVVSIAGNEKPLIVKECPENAVIKRVINDCAGGTQNINVNPAKAKMVVLDGSTRIIPVRVMENCGDEVSVDVEYVCNEDTNVYDRIVTTTTNGVTATPVVTPTTIKCDDETPDFEQVRVCDTTTNTIHLITNSIADDGTITEVHNVDTNEKCKAVAVPDGSSYTGTTVVTPPVEVKSITISKESGKVEVSFDGGGTYPLIISANGTRTWGDGTDAVLNTSNMRFKGNSTAKYDLIYEI